MTRRTHRLRVIAGSAVGGMTERAGAAQPRVPTPAFLGSEITVQFTPTPRRNDCFDGEIPSVLNLSVVRAKRPSVKVVQIVGARGLKKTIPVPTLGRKTMESPASGPMVRIRKGLHS